MHPSHSTANYSPHSLAFHQQATVAHCCTRTSTLVLQPFITQHWPWHIDANEDGWRYITMPPVAASEHFLSRHIYRHPHSPYLAPILFSPRNLQKFSFRDDLFWPQSKPDFHFLNILTTPTSTVFLTIEKATSKRSLLPQPPDQSHSLFTAHITLFAFHFFYHAIDRFSGRNNSRSSLPWHVSLSLYFFFNISYIIVQFNKERFPEIHAKNEWMLVD